MGQWDSTTVTLDGGETLSPPPLAHPSANAHVWETTVACISLSLSLASSPLPTTRLACVWSSRKRTARMAGLTREGVAARRSIATDCRTRPSKCSSTRCARGTSSSSSDPARVFAGSTYPARMIQGLGMCFSRWLVLGLVRCSALFGSATGRVLYVRRCVCCRVFACAAVCVDIGGVAHSGACPGAACTFTSRVRRTQRSSVLLSLPSPFRQSSLRVPFLCPILPLNGDLNVHASTTSTPESTASDVRAGCPEGCGETHEVVESLAL